MYDDDVQAVPYSKSFYVPAPFPTRNIVTPIVLLYGTRDSLVDIDAMLSQLPDHTVATGIKDYEHVDILWGKDVDTLVIPRVLEALKGEEGKKTEPEDDGDYDDGTGDPGSTSPPTSTLLVD